MRAGRVVRVKDLVAALDESERNDLHYLTGHHGRMGDDAFRLPEELSDRITETEAEALARFYARHHGEGE